MLGLALTLVAPVVAQEPAREPTLKATMNLVNLFATVRDKNKRIVGVWFAKTLADFEINDIVALPLLLCYNS